MERSITEVIENGLRDAEAQYHLAYLLNAAVAGDKVTFTAQFLTRRLTPVLTAIQEHEATCPTFQIGAKTGVTFTVDGQALPPLYTSEAQTEVGGAITSRYHTGE